MSDTAERPIKAERFIPEETDLDNWQLRLVRDLKKSTTGTLVRDSKLEADTTGIFRLPNELIGEIGLFVQDPIDFGNLRLVNHRFYSALNIAFAKNFGDGRLLFPRYNSFHAFFAFLASVDVSCLYIDRIILVSEGMKEHEYGYDWAWEDLINWNNIDVTNEDMAAMYKANMEHAEEVACNTEPFLNTGGYRSLLRLLLTSLPKLRTIEIRKMAPGEHSPGWKGPDILKRLSFYHPTLNTNAIYYGDWQYDTIHLRVTRYKDEFGDDIIEPDAGPQASCVDDIKAAVAATDHKARLVFLHSV